MNKKMIKVTIEMEDDIREFETQALLGSMLQNGADETMQFFIGGCTTEEITYLMAGCINNLCVCFKDAEFTKEVVGAALNKATERWIEVQSKEYADESQS